MKTFSRLSLLTLLFLGFAFMLIGNTVYAQLDNLEVYTAAGQAGYDIGDPVTLTFFVTPEDAIDLTVSWAGFGVTSVVGAGGVIAGPYISGSVYTTDKDTGSIGHHGPNNVTRLYLCVGRFGLKGVITV